MKCIKRMGLLHKLIVSLESAKRKELQYTVCLGITSGGNLQKVITFDKGLVDYFF